MKFARFGSRGCGSGRKAGGETAGIVAVEAPVIEL